MSLIAWRDEFATGIQAVDHEHREMIGLINRLYDDLVATDDREALTGFLGELLARISAHFALEEKIMRERRYDQYQDHKNDHERLLDEIRDIMDACQQGPTVIADELAGRLERWFVGHFKAKDARLHHAIVNH